MLSAVISFVGTLVVGDKLLPALSNTIPPFNPILISPSPVISSTIAVYSYPPAISVRVKFVTVPPLIVFEGHFMRNYLHVRDAANAFIFAMDNFEKMNGQTYNCGLSNSNLSKIELCEKIKKFIPQFTYIEAQTGTDPDKRNYLVSNDKIEGLGFRPQYTLDDGIKELMKAYSIIKNSFYGNV